MPQWFNNNGTYRQELFILYVKWHIYRLFIQKLLKRETPHKMIRILKVKAFNTNINWLLFFIRISEKKSKGGALLETTCIGAGLSQCIKFNKRSVWETRNLFETRFELSSCLPLSIRVRFSLLSVHTRYSGEHCQSVRETVLWSYFLLRRERCV